MNSRRTWMFLIFDSLAIVINYFIAFFLRFEMEIPERYIDSLLKVIVFVLIAKLAVFAIFKMYRIIWEFASIGEMIRIFGATLAANVLSSSLMMFMAQGLPRSTYPLVLILDIIVIGGIRFLPRIIKSQESGSPISRNIKKTLIVGAGDAGVLVAKELKKHKELGNVPVAFIDDDPDKKGQSILNIKVVGTREDIVRAVKSLDIEEIIVAMPSCDKDELKEILDNCSKTGVKVRIVPGIYEMIEDRVELKDIRDIEIDDLLGREEIHLNTDELSGMIKNKVILVTGGGGSIGSELSRQVAKYKPKKLLLLDIYENTTYDIQNELIRNYPDLNLRVFIESIRDRERLDKIFEEYKPNIIFHAAAHKHVPLMEGSPESAVKNNVFGTLNLILEADKHGVEKFVQISTDKAVNPTNIMGCTKRICEMLVQSFNRLSKTDYVAVRFGNVLGSNGSVIPLFLRQINSGGPVTVTDERIIRYFMSIPEAVQLVMQAGAIAKGGEIFVLDMGEPVKIIDLAEKLIRLHGKEPYTEMPIKIVGLRPGEKLYEEILVDKNIVDKTKYDRIFIEKPEDLDFHKIEESLIPLLEATKLNNRDIIVKELEKIVPTFHNYVPKK